jgi:hypothetical protein
VATSWAMTAFAAELRDDGFDAAAPDLGDTIEA